MNIVLKFLILSCLVKAANFQFPIAEWNVQYNLKTDPNAGITTLKYRVKKEFPVFRVTLECNESSINNVLLVSLRQRDSIIGLHVPRIIENYEFDKVSRTLCPLEHIREGDMFTIEVSSYQSLWYSVRADTVTDFELGTDETRLVTASASQPVYLHYRFPEGIDRVMVNVNSNSSTCMTLSIQDVACLAFDLQSNVKYKGMYATVTSRGIIQVNKSAMKEFFVVFVINENDDLCTDWINIKLKNPTVLPISSKSFYVTVKSFQSHSYTSILSLSAVSLGIPSILFYVVAVIFALRPKCYEQKQNPGVIDPPIEPQQPNGGDQDQLIEGQRPNEHGNLQRFLENNEGNHDAYDSITLYLLIAIVFCAYGTVQMLLRAAYDNKESGNNDICVYNYACANSWWILVAANSVLSNTLYLTAGTILWIMAKIRENQHRKEEQENQRRHNPERQICGIYVHFGIKKALGFSIMAEGFFSAFYHICPTRHNFQFDTLGMFIIAFLCIKQTWSKRHQLLFPIIYSIVYCLLITTIAVIQIYCENNFLFAIYASVHSVAFLFLLYFFFYDGRNGMELTLWNRVKQSKCKVVFITSVILLHGLIIFLLDHNDLLTTELFSLLATVGLYQFYYIGKKIQFEWKHMTWAFIIKNLILLILVAVSWIIAAHFFFKEVSNWKATPAHSRELNHDCILLNFYDAHDIWHALSAFALLLSGLFMNTIDDNLKNTPRNEIKEF